MTNTATNIPNITDVDKLNGFANTKAIYELKTEAVTAPTRAWTFQSKYGNPVVTGSSGWFLPSLGQMKAIYNCLGEEKSGLVYESGYMIWTSTESSALNAWTWYHYNGEYYEAREKTQSCLGFACFAY